MGEMKFVECQKSSKIDQPFLADWVTLLSKNFLLTALITKFAQAKKAKLGYVGEFFKLFSPTWSWLGVRKRL